MDIQDLLRNSMIVVTFLAVGAIERKIKSMEKKVDHIYNCCVESEEDD